MYTELILKSILSKEPVRMRKIPRSLIKYARRNKVLYTLGLYDERIQLTKDWIELDKRRKEQMNAIIELIELSEKLNIPFLIVKTLKPFDYVPDDIDVLIINEECLSQLVNALLKRGYFIRKKGTPEITLRRIVRNDIDTVIDLDIHVKLAAGPYEYIDKHYLWQRRKVVKVQGVLVPVPNEIDELLITAAHAVMKELSITMADVLHVLSISRNTLITALNQSRKIGLSVAVRFVLDITRRVIHSLKGASSVHTIYFPIKVPLHVVLQSYKENLIHRLKVHSLRPLKEIISTPSSKGIGILLRYLGL